MSFFEKFKGMFKQASFNIKDVSNSIISINGDKVTSGNNMSIVNGKVFIDGNELKTGDVKELNITIIGDVDNLDIALCNNVKINGNCGKIDVTSGKVEIDGTVKGNVETTSGGISISGDVGGNVETVSGKVQANTIMGKCSTVSGNISK